MLASHACRAALLGAALSLCTLATGRAMAGPVPAAGASASASATPGDRLAELAGKTFGFMADEADGVSMLVRFEQVPGQGYRVVETDRHGTRTTTIAGTQRGVRWRGKAVNTYQLMDTHDPVDFKVDEDVSVGSDGALLLAWSRWGSASERRFRLLDDGALERQARNPQQQRDWDTTRQVAIDSTRETLLLDQIALEGELFREDVAARVQVLMAESEERRRRNREQFWNGLAQAAVVLATAAAEVAAEMEARDGGPLPALAGAPAAQPVASAPLRFVMLIGLANRAGDTVNPTCYSNIVTRPGPPGWGAPGFLPSGSSEQARQSVEAQRDQFIAKCRASGREITGLGNFEYRWNQSPGDEQRVADTRPRHAEDVLVAMD